ncbi:MAG: response regulator [Candidatus Omnitrophica bacterium]|nr:response regulator [Candidatus Omnitrophota bacterium]
MTKLLTIDDEKEFTDFIRSYFELRGFSVFVANDGEEGVRIAEIEQPEVALVDLKMPGKHGDEVLEDMLRISPKTRTIMITASEGYGNARERLMAMGAFACFDKPLVSVKDLENKIKEALLHE